LNQKGLVTEKIIELLKKTDSKLTCNQIYDILDDCIRSSIRGRLSEMVKKEKIKRQDGLYWIEK